MKQYSYKSEMMNRR